MLIGMSKDPHTGIVIAGIPAPVSSRKIQPKVIVEDLK